MNILVTGGLGYIGSTLSVDLSIKGHTVYCLDRSDNIPLKERLWSLANDIEFIKADISCPEELKKVFESYSFDSIFHLAASKSVPESEVKYFDYYHNNVVASLNLLQASSQCGVKNFIFASSAAVYSDKNSYLPENSLLNPLSTYGHTKLIFEQIINNISKLDQTMKFLTLRFFNPIGYTDSFLAKHFISDGAGLFDILAREIQKKNPQFTIYGDNFQSHDGSATRDFISLSSLSEFSIKCFESLSKGEINSGEVLNIGSGQGISVIEVITAFERVFNKKFNIKVAPKREGEIDTSVCSTERLLNTFGNIPKNPPLEQIINSYKLL